LHPGLGSFYIHPLLTILLILFMLSMPGCGGGGGAGESSAPGSAGVGADSPQPGSGGEGGVPPETSGEIVLGWTPNTEPDLAGYRVYYRTTSGVYGNPIDVGRGTQSGDLMIYSLTNLTKGQVYCVAVTAYDVSGNLSGFSEEICGDAW